MERQATFAFCSYSGPKEGEIMCRLLVFLQLGNLFAINVCAFPPFHASITSYVITQQMKKRNRVNICVWTNLDLALDLIIPTNSNTLHFACHLMFRHCSRAECHQTKHVCVMICSCGCYPSPIQCEEYVLLSQAAYCIMYPVHVFYFIV